MRASGAPLIHILRMLRQDLLIAIMGGWRYVILVRLMGIARGGSREREGETKQASKQASKQAGELG
jgi:hypothetical protein